MNSYDRTDFEILKSVDIKNVDKGSLIDLNGVQIDDTRPGIRENSELFTADTESILFSYWRCCRKSELQARWAVISTEFRGPFAHSGTVSNGNVR